jgi:hypothetical protein
MGKKSWLVAALCVVVFAAVSAGSAFAGEVKGPPGTSTEADPNYTAARENANSNCAYSGLNDFDPPAGRTAEHVQSWGQLPQEVRAFLTTIGEHPGDACRGGSNPNRDK